MATPVLLPTGLVGFRAERLLLAVADRLDVAGADATLRQRALDGARAAVAQCQVILRGSALVAMSLNREVNVGVRRKESDIRLQRTLLVRTNIRFVILEINVLDVLGEELFIARPGRWRRRWWRLSHGHSCRCLLRSTGSFRRQGIGGRVRRRNRLRTVRLHGSYT